MKELKLEKVPKVPPFWTLLGPAFVWASVAQGSGELIGWPYFAAKYGTAMIGLVLPACFFQYFVNQEVPRYTALTGEGIWSGFKRVNWLYSVFLFVLAFICNPFSVRLPSIGLGLTWLFYFGVALWFLITTFVK